MKGLEISEVRYSEFNQQENILGAEFYNKEKLQCYSRINSKYKISDFFINKIELVDNTNGAICYDLTHSSNQFLSSGYFVNTINSTKKLVKEDDFIISRLRSYLKEMAIVQKQNVEQLVSSEYLVYTAKTNLLTTKTLLVYCLTDEVQTILNFSQYGSEHPRFYDSVLNNLPIPECLLKLNSSINNLLEQVYENLEHSKLLYEQAEELLLEELGLNDWTPKNELTSIKKLNESFLSSGRLDAEYYQKKYDEIEEKIKSYKGGYKLIINYFQQNISRIDFNKKEYNYIEIGDINISDGSINYNIVPTEELPENAKIELHKNDLLISTVRPYRGAVAILYEEIKDVIGSGAFTVLQEKTTEYNKETLMVLLRTFIYKDLLLKFNVGTSYPVIKDEDVLNLPVPIIDKQVQQAIADKIQESFRLRRESKDLLQKAVKMLEDEIEKGL